MFLYEHENQQVSAEWRRLEYESGRLEYEMRNRFVLSRKLEFGIVFLCSHLCLVTETDDSQNQFNPQNFKAMCIFIIVSVGAMIGASYLVKNGYVY